MSLEHVFIKTKSAEFSKLQAPVRNTNFHLEKSTMKKSKYNYKAKLATSKMYINNSVCTR